jgi:tetratricopeptide (TPR) repeat protein
MRILIVVSLLCVMLPRAAAQTTRDIAQAKAEFNRAEVHYSVREFADALKLYTSAYKIAQFPEFLFNIAQCHRQLKNYDMAIFFYRRYLGSNAKTVPKHREEVLGFIEECKVAKENQSPVSSDNPQPARVEIPVGSTEQEHVSLERSPPLADADDRLWARRSAVWIWTGIGLSSALLITAAVTGGLAIDMNQEYKDPDTSDARASDLKDTGQRLEITAAVTLGLGLGAAAVTALYYWFPRPADRGSAASVSIIPLSDGGMLGAVGRF